MINDLGTSDFRNNGPNPIKVLRLAYELGFPKSYIFLYIYVRIGNSSSRIAQEVL